MPSEVKGYKAMRARNQKWKAFYENPLDYLWAIANAATDAAKADMVAQGLVDTGYTLANLRPNVRPGYKRNTWEATIAGPGQHPSRGMTAIRTVTFARRRHGLVDVKRDSAGNVIRDAQGNVITVRNVQYRTVTFGKQGLDWRALARMWAARSGGRIQFPRPSVIRAAIKPAVDRIKELAKQFTSDVKALESAKETA